MNDINYNVGGPSLNISNIVYNCLMNMKLSYTVDDEGNGIHLVDRLTPDCDSDITRGKDEIAYMTIAIVDKLLSENNYCNGIIS